MYYVFVCLSKRYETCEGGSGIALCSYNSTIKLWLKKTPQRTFLKDEF
jgi:hypothetical protein